jgi:hypothetical protein
LQDPRGTQVGRDRLLRDRSTNSRKAWEVSMVERAFEFLFVLSLLVPSIAVFIGLFLVGVPRILTRHSAAPRAGVPAHS